MVIQHGRATLIESVRIDNGLADGLIRKQGRWKWDDLIVRLYDRTIAQGDSVSAGNAI